MFLDQIKRIDKQLTSINDLLLVGDIVRVAHNKIAEVSGVVVKTVIDESDYQMGIATYAHKGDATEEHSHFGIIQYVIQVEGRTAVFFGEGAYRVVDVGECCAIKPGEVHKFTALSDNAVQVWVCIPAEVGYKIDMNELVKG